MIKELKQGSEEIVELTDYHTNVQNECADHGCEDPSVPFHILPPSPVPLDPDVQEENNK